MEELWVAKDFVTYGYVTLSMRNTFAMWGSVFINIESFVPGKMKYRVGIVRPRGFGSGTIPIYLEAATWHV